MNIGMGAVSTSPQTPTGGGPPSFMDGANLWFANPMGAISSIGPALSTLSNPSSMGLLAVPAALILVILYMNRSSN
ncbi:MAG: hypothetical protein U0Q18_25345 [Bryobacteraceae bacterium]